MSFPLFRLRGDYFAFATLALLPLFELLATNLVAITRGADGILLPPATAMIDGIDVKMYAYYVALAASVAVFCLSIWMSRTPFGYALKAIRNDEQAAEVVGIRIFPMKLQAMAYGAMAAAVAGGAYVWSFRYIDPRTVFGLDVALIPVAMALLGGSGLLWGPLIGAVLLSVGIQFLIVKLTMLQFTIIGLAILLIGRFMPGGLLRARFCSACRCSRRSARSITSGSRATAQRRSRACRWSSRHGCRLRRIAARTARAFCWRRATSPWRSAATSPSTG